ncbi:PREDICTED: uncharacterized protein LOC104824642 [Tarenaya hassleriana]|uniref:uncharacterized protein LOC104824642 n=1 Tax=Tarenaya hassleriana TaxID=28532 RepID=UPI0008FD2472|nr:PREDICTED: uncharacterized protein LOC104824642 [Tarenaya hassleriana]
MEQTRDTDGGKKEREAPQKELSKTLDEIFSPLQTESEFARKPRPRQSGDVKSGFAQLEENAAAVEDEDEDEGVDAKADDFINKFKEQLKLQRIESWRRSNGWTIDEGV